jgi:hypothetical protein
VTELIRTSAVFEGGVLKLCQPLTELADGDRVELTLVRVSTSNAPAVPPVDPDDDYDLLAAMNATRLAQGERPLIPPTEVR